MLSLVSRRYLCRYDTAFTLEAVLFGCHRLYRVTERSYYHIQRNSKPVRVLLKILKLFEI